ncbi:isocitrate lyase/PEP mutase family protein [Parerythrobacter aurantius]|uniref:isocitrate lyase/PEP mutase family protein n=1 Tax=Parerythrobacter aurantius TaxID=3127706 RepID=UPI00324944FE
MGTGLSVNVGAHRFAELLNAGGLITAPGVYDGLSARLAAASGAQALYLTGYGVSASLLGQPDAGFLGRGDMVGRIERLLGAVDVPLIVDADTGFGDVAETVRAYEAAGAAAIQIEDQRFPKRCGHTPGREVVPLEEALDRIKAALDARQDRAFKIVARTDARTAHGLAAAIERAQAFHELGADILFVESPESVEELEAIGKAIPGAKLLANMVAGGRTPFLPPSELAAMGFAVAIYPVMGLAASASALQAAYAGLASGVPDTSAHMPFADLNRTVGFEAIWAEDDCPD